MLQRRKALYNSSIMSHTICILAQRQLASKRRKAVSELIHSGNLMFVKVKLTSRVSV